MRNTITVTLCSLMLLFASSSSHAQRSVSPVESVLRGLIRENLPFKNFLVYAVGSGNLKDDHAFGGAITFGFGGVSGIELRGMNESASGKNSAGDFSFDSSVAVHTRFAFPLGDDDSVWLVWATGYESIFIDIENSEIEIDDSYRADSFSVGTEFLYEITNSLFMSLGYYLRWIPESSIDLQDNDGRRYYFVIDEYVAHQGLLGVGFKF